MDLDTTQHSDVISFPATPTIRQLKDVAQQYIDDFDCLTDSEMRHVIPRVYDKNANARGSKSKWTKAPGRLRDKNGDLVRRAVEIRGYTDWPKRLYSEYPPQMTDEQRARFDEESELIKVHTQDWAFGFILGENYVAIDCDLEDTDKSEQVLDVLTEVIGKPFPIRSRGGARWATIVRVIDGDAEQYGKNDLSVKCNGGHDVEIFTKDSHIVISGKHPDGGDYAWYCEPFGTFPEITMAQLLSFREKVGSLFGVDGRTRVFKLPFRKRTREFKGDPCNLKAFCGEDKDFYALFKSCLASVRADYLRESEWFIEEDDEKIYLHCMNEAEHSTHTGDKQTCYFKSSGGFKCFHSHCENITREQVEDYYFKKAPKTTIERLVNDCTRCAVIKDHIWLSHFNPSAQAVAIVLNDTSLIGFELRADRFTTNIEIRFINAQIYHNFYTALQIEDGKIKDWNELNADRIDTCLQAHLGSLGFVDGRIRYWDVLRSVAWSHAIDSVLERVAKLPAWDGVKRVENFILNYIADPDETIGQTEEYLKTVSRYFWTSLVGRATCTDPQGIKVDTCLILTGDGGARKSELAKAVSLGLHSTYSFNGGDRDERMKLHQAGAVVFEVAEMAGAGKKENDALKAFLTEQVDSYRAPYDKAVQKHPRRSVFIMTTNYDDFCKDETGNRRYAPVSVRSKIDDQGIRDACEQLWAEALVMFKENGIMWQGLDKLTEIVNKNYEPVDSWCEPIQGKIEQRERKDPDPRFTYGDIYNMLNGLPIDKRDNRSDARIRKIMIRLGFEYKQDSSDGKRRWRRRSRRV